MAIGRDEVLAAVGSEGMRLEPEDTGSDPFLEPGTRCCELAGLLHCCCQSAPLMRQIVRTEIDRMVDSTGMEHKLAAA